MRAIGHPNSARIPRRVGLRAGAGAGGSRSSLPSAARKKLNDPSADRLESPDEIKGRPGKPM
jgi:hypothetical protein